MLVGGLSRPLLVGWRIILPSACLACSAGNFACCRSPIYLILHRYCSRLCGRLFGYFMQHFPRIFCCQSGESYENVGDDDDNIVNIFSDE